MIIKIITCGERTHNTPEQSVGFCALCFVHWFLHSIGLAFTAIVVSVHRARALYHSLGLIYFLEDCCIRSQKCLKLCPSVAHERPRFCTCGDPCMHWVCKLSPTSWLLAKELDACFQYYTLPCQCLEYFNIEWFTVCRLNMNSMTLVALLSTVVSLVPTAVAHYALHYPEARNICNLDRRWSRSGGAGQGMMKLSTWIQYLNFVTFTEGFVDLKLNNAKYRRCLLKTYSTFTPRVYTFRSGLAPSFIGPTSRSLS